MLSWRPPACSYDTRYVNNKTGALDVTEAAVDLARGYAQGIDVGLSGMSANMSVMLACASLQPNASTCPLGASASQLVQNSLDMMENQIEIARIMYQNTAERYAVYASEAQQRLADAEATFASIGVYLDNNFPELPGSGLGRIGFSTPSLYVGYTPADEFPTITLPDGPAAIGDKVSGAVDQFQANIGNLQQYVQAESSVLLDNIRDTALVDPLGDYDPPETNLSSTQEYHRRRCESHPD